MNHTLSFQPELTVKFSPSIFVNPKLKSKKTGKQEYCASYFIFALFYFRFRMFSSVAEWDINHKWSVLLDVSSGSLRITAGQCMLTESGLQLKPKVNELFEHLTIRPSSLAFNSASYQQAKHKVALLGPYTCTHPLQWSVRDSRWLWLSLELDYDWR